MGTVDARVVCCLCSDLPSRSYDCLKVCLQAPTITLFFHALCIANTILILSLAGALARIFSLNLRTYVCTYVRRFCYLHTFLVFGVVPLMSVRLLWLFIFFFFFFLHSGVRLRAHLRCQLRDRLRVRPHPRRGCWTPHAQRFGGLRSHGHHGGESVAGKTGAGGGSGCGLVLVMSLPVRWLLLFDVGVDVT